MQTKRQKSFVSLVHKRRLRCERFLEEMESVVPWEEFLGELLSVYEKKTKFGRKKTDLLMLLKIYFLQQWYNLSDPGAEEAIYDRNSFQKFLNIDVLADKVPDETTILNFRRFLEDNKFQKRFFALVSELLEENNLIMKEGTITDATIVSAPSSTKNKDKKRDPEMSSTKKGNTWHFGMKAHIGVDNTQGLIHSVKTSTARIHDSSLYDDLLHGEEKYIFGDKGYYSLDRKQKARKKGIYFGILDKGTRGRHLSSSQEKKNRKKSSVRSKVEFPFQVIKCQWNYRKVRYRGLFKNSMNLYALFALANLFKARKKLMLA